MIRAFKVLQDRHKDVLLITAWHNPWPATMSTMQASPYIQLPSASGTYDVVIRDLLNINGIDPARSIILGETPNELMSRFYKETDVGLFPIAAKAAPTLC